MKYKTTILSILASIVIGCSSPLDVPANRKEYIDNDKSNSLLSTSPTTINFGYINRYKEVIMPFQITNMNTMAFSMRTLDFGSASKYSLPNLDLPMEIDEKGQPGSIQLFHVRFFSSDLGEFTDTMETNGLTNPKLYVQAIVPDIFCEDVTFGSVSVNNTATKNLLIYNYTDNTLEIESVNFGDYDEFFSVDSTKSLIVEPHSKTGNPTEIPVYFSSKFDQLYETTAEIIFKSGTQGKLVKNIVLVKAASI